MWLSVHIGTSRHAGKCVNKKWGKIARGYYSSIFFTYYRFSNLCPVESGIRGISKDFLEPSIKIYA